MENFPFLHYNKKSPSIPQLTTSLYFFTAGRHATSHFLTKERSSFKGNGVFSYKNISNFFLGHAPGGVYFFYPTPFSQISCHPSSDSFPQIWSSQYFPKKKTEMGFPFVRPPVCLLFLFGRFRLLVKKRKVTRLLLPPPSSVWEAKVSGGSLLRES